MDKELDELYAERCEMELGKNQQYSELHKKLAEAYDNNDIDALYELASAMRFITASTSYKLAIKDIFYMVYTK